MSALFDGLENARRISFEKFSAIPAHLRRFRAYAYTYTALRPPPPHLTPDLPDFFKSRVAGSEMRRADHLAPTDPGRDTRPVRSLGLFGRFSFMTSIV